MAPKISRPKFPKGYVDHPTSEVTWEYVEKRLIDSVNYWLCTVRPNGAPHVIPRWGVFVDGRFYYDGSPETRHARNLEQNPNVTLHLESGTDVVIMDGTSQPAPKPDQWDEGGLYVFTPRQCLAWTVFFENPTKFVF